MSNSQTHQEVTPHQLLPIPHIFRLIRLHNRPIPLDLILRPVALILPSILVRHPPKTVNNSLLPTALVLAPVIELHFALAVDLSALEVAYVDAFWCVNDSLPHLIFIIQESAAIQREPLLIAQLAIPTPLSLHPITLILLLIGVDVGAPATVEVLVPGAFVPGACRVDDGAFA